MKAATKRVMSSFQNAQLLENVGRPINQPRIVQPTSWQEAMSSEGIEEHLNFLLLRSHDISDSMTPEVWDQLGEKWNRCAVKLRPICVEIVKPLLAKIPLCPSLAKRIIDSIRWDIGHACLETEFGDITGSKFFRGWAEWYLKGHYPCGWSGKYPKGSPIVF